MHTLYFLVSVFNDLRRLYSIFIKSPIQCPIIMVSWSLCGFRFNNMGLIRRYLFLRQWLVCFLCIHQRYWFLRPGPLFESRLSFVTQIIHNFLHLIHDTINRRLFIRRSIVCLKRGKWYCLPYFDRMTFYYSLQQQQQLT